MNRSESLVELTKALSKVQAVLEEAKRDSVNPFHHSTYADLSSVWAVCRQPLSDNGFAIVQTIDFQEGVEPLIVETTLLHSSGEWVSSRLAMHPGKDDPQSYGSAITYARRYSLAAMIGVSPEDDDAEQTMSRGQEVGQTKRPTAPQTKAHWCALHQTAFFKTAKMRAYAHPIKGTDPVVWCHEPEVKPEPPQPEDDDAATGSSPAKNAPHRPDARPKTEMPAKDLEKWQGGGKVELPQMFESFGQVAGAAMNIGVSGPEVFAKAGVEKWTDFTSFGEAWDVVCTVREEKEAGKPQQAKMGGS